MGQEWSKVRYILTYTFNWRRQIDGGEGFGHLWSLAVEEQFYIFWPPVVALLLVARRKLAFTISVLVFAIAFVAFHRIQLWNGGEVWLWLIMRTDARADSLLMGALLAVLWTRGITFPVRAVRPAVWISVTFLIGCFLFAHEDRAFLYLGGFTAVALAAAIVIYALVERVGVLPTLLSTRPLVVVGRVSYGVYLWHLPAFTVVQRYGMDWSVAVRLVVAYGATATLTVVSWFAIERPFLLLKTRLEQTREERAIATAAIA
jgi:peptidoglycan/LPS O-acetylase OafA/YrhL